jgi:hypothetical protein
MEYEFPDDKDVALGSVKKKRRGIGQQPFFMYGQQLFTLP